jgi:phosphoribosylglycinamide formyltransferase-1
MVHWAPDESVDSGPVVVSEAVPIYSSDTLETLEARVHSVEHDLYVRAIAEVLEVGLG